MIKDKSKLVKKQIVDKTGKRTSVWVSSGGDVIAKKKNVSSENTRISELSKNLQGKVRRQGKGQGKEVTLTKGEVKELLDKGTVGFVSAGRNPSDPKDVKLSDKEVTKRTKDLKEDLKERGFQFVKVNGKYGEEEESFMVMIPDVSKDEMSEIGSKYNQDSIIYSEGRKNQMIFTTGKNQGKSHGGEGFYELDKKTTDFYTEIETSTGKVKFSLNFNFDRFEKGILGEAFESLGVVKNITDSNANPITTGDPVMINAEEMFEKDDEDDEDKKKKDIKKAKDTSKLMRKQITDKRGHRTTVWVKTGGGQAKQTKHEDRKKEKDSAIMDKIRSHPKKKEIIQVMSDDIFITPKDALEQVEKKSGKPDVSTQAKRDKIWADAEATSKKVQEQSKKHDELKVKPKKEGGYKLGAKYSSDFDYDGMLEAGSKATIGMGANKLQKLFNSYEDVNYHREGSHLSMAIDELKDGNKDDAKSHMDKFNEASKKTLGQ